MIDWFKNLTAKNIRGWLILLAVLVVLCWFVIFNPAFRILFEALMGCLVVMGLVNYVMSCIMD